VNEAFFPCLAQAPYPFVALTFPSSPYFEIHPWGLKHIVDIVADHIAAYYYKNGTDTADVENIGNVEHDAGYCTEDIGVGDIGGNQQCPCC